MFSISGSDATRFCSGSHQVATYKTLKLPLRISILPAIDLILIREEVNFPNSLFASVVAEIPSHLVSRLIRLSHVSSKLRFFSSLVFIFPPDHLLVFFLFSFFFSWGVVRSVINLKFTCLI
jgi:hypothetical protein